MVFEYEIDDFFVDQELGFRREKLLDYPKIPPIQNTTLNWWKTYGYQTKFATGIFGSQLVFRSYQ